MRDREVKRHDITKALQAAGFVSRGGSKHEIFVHPDERRTTVGRHKDIPSRTVYNIEKQAKIKLPK